MPTIDEKRVYTDNTGTETVYLASGLGVVAVSVSDDLIGEFGVAHRCRARDVATAGALVAVATDEDVLLAARDDGGDTEEGSTETSGGGSDRDLDFRSTGFGPATAVGFDGETLLAGDESGRVARVEDVETDDGWGEIGTATAVRAIDGRLVAAEDGVYRVGRGGLTHAGLDDARDVDDEPLVATGSGLFKLGNGWMDVLDGPVDAVDAAGARGLAVRSGTLYSRVSDVDAVGSDDSGGGAGSGGSTDGAGSVEAVDGSDADAWEATSLPVPGDVVAVSHGREAAYAVTGDGTLAVRLPGEEWRHRELGVRDVAAAAV